MEKKSGKIFRYGLIGKRVINPFVEEMGVKGIEKLVGREVFAFTIPHNSMVKGIAVRK